MAWLRAARSKGRRRRPTIGVLAAVVAMAGAVFVLRLTVRDPSASVLVLLCVPVALVAVVFGAAAGLGAAAAATAAIGAWQAVGGDPGGVVGYLSRATAFVTLGYGLGWFADRFTAALDAERAAAVDATRAHQELEEAQRLGNIGSWTWDAATDRLTWSSEMFRIFDIDPTIDGFTPADIRDSRSHPDDAPRAVAAREQALREHQPFEFAQRLVLPDGSVRHVLNRGEVVLDATNAVVGMRGTTQDVTRLAEAERDAVAATSRLTAVVNTMLDALTVGAAVRDADGRIVDFEVLFTNEVSSVIYGRAAAEIVGRRWSDIWPERFGTELFDRYIRLVDAGEAVELTDYPYPVHERDGIRWRVVDLRAARLGDGYVAVWRDVTDRAEAALERQRAAAQFAAAFDGAPVGMALIDDGLVVLRANAALSAITGRAPEQLAGVRFDELADPDDRDGARADLQAVVHATLPMARSELRFTTLGGDARWGQLIAARIADGGREVAVVHVEDVHERREQTDALSRANATLAASNAALDQLASVAAHDLRSPLVTIGGFASLIESEHDLPATVKDTASRIVAGVDRMNGLIEDLLAYARAGGAHESLPVPLMAVVEGVRDLLAGEIECAGATVTANDLPVVEGDRVALRQLFLNLIANSLKFRRPGAPPRITVRATPVDRRWEIEIEDNGVGLTPGSEAKLFELFRRGANASGVTGTGIGLAICRRVVESHGGRIDARAALRHGTIVRFDLPATRSQVSRGGVGL